MKKRAKLHKSHFPEAHKTWCSAIHYYQATTRRFDSVICGRLWARDKLHNVLFWLYAILPFGFLFAYFLGRMLAYKRDWLKVSQGKTWRKNRRKWKRGFLRARSFERGKFRRRYYRRQSALRAWGATCGACSSCVATCDACSSDVTTPAVFTTVLNTDKHTNNVLLTRRLKHCARPYIFCHYSKSF